MSKRKVLYFFTASYPFGKIELFIENEIAFLSAKFRKIVIIPYSYGGSKVPRTLPDNVELMLPVMEDNKYRVLLGEIFNFSPVGFFFREVKKRRLWTDLKMLKQCLLASLRTRKVLSSRAVKEALKSNPDETVFYFYWGTMAANIVPLINKCIIPKVVRFHGGDLYEYRKGALENIFFREELLKSLTYAVFISQDGEKYLHEKYNKIKFNSRVFRLGVFDRGLNESGNDDVFRIVSCSSVIPVKRLDFLVETLKYLTSKIEWTHIGDGYLLDEIKQKSKELPENVKVEFPGFLSNEEINKYYLSATIDLFINVSESEGVPVSIMEALSFGIPVFAKDIGGISELVSNSVGRLLPADITASGLAEQIESFRRLNSNIKRELRVNARAVWNRVSNAEKNYSEFTDFLTGICL